MTGDQNDTQVLSGNALEKFFSGEETSAPTETQEPTETLETFFSDAPKDTAASEVVVPKEEPTTTVQTTPSLNYKDIVAEFIADGDWTDAEIEMEEGQEPVAISDLAEITPELFRQLKAAQKQLKEEQLNTDYVSVKGLDDTTRRMLEIKRAGGDITELLKVEAQHVHPLQGLDLDSEQIQENLVRQRLRHQGIDADIIDFKIKKLKDSLTLDLEAKKVIDEVNNNFNGLVKQKEEEAKEYNTKLQEEQKVFKKSMTDTFRKFELKDSLVKNLVENTSKYDENGLTDADKMFFSAKENPELFAEVVFLLSNKQAYDEYKGVKIKNEVKKDTIKTILKLNPKTSTAPSAAPKPKDVLQEFFES